MAKAIYLRYISTCWRIHFNYTVYRLYLNTNFKTLNDSRLRKKSDLQIDLMSGLERGSFVMNLDEIDAGISNLANDATESNHWAIIDIT